MPTTHCVFGKPETRCRMNLKPLRWRSGGYFLGRWGAFLVK